MYDQRSLRFSAMPDELARAVAALGVTKRRAATVGWHLIGVPGRTWAQDELNRGRTDWDRRRRCRHIVRRLIAAVPAVDRKAM